MRFRTERGLFDHDSATHQGIKPYKEILIQFFKLGINLKYLKINIILINLKVLKMWDGFQRPVEAQNTSNSSHGSQVNYSSILFSKNKKIKFRPFTCSICSKGFRTKFNLQRHEKTHRKKMKTTSCEPKTGMTILINFDSIFLHSAITIRKCNCSFL